MVIKRNNTKFITAVPADSGRVVAMIEYKNQVILACEHHIYQLGSDDVFRKIKFEEVSDGYAV